MENQDIFEDNQEEMFNESEYICKIKRKLNHEQHEDRNIDELA